MKTIIARILKDKEPTIMGDRLLVPTDCMYFGGTMVFVEIAIAPNKDGIIVDDDLGAVDRILALGRRVPRRGSYIGSLEEDYGVTISEDYQISLKIDSIDDISPAIAIVANASVELADKLFEHSDEHSIQKIK